MGISISMEAQHRTLAQKAEDHQQNQESGELHGTEISMLKGRLESSTRRKGRMSDGRALSPYISFRVDRGRSDRHGSLANIVQNLAKNC